jgi:nicotinamide mononucleotide transporter
MVAKKLIENWIYWFVIDLISVFLFLTRDLYLTAGLFIVYLIIVVFGYKTWKKSMIENKNGAADSNRQLR